MFHGFFYQIKDKINLKFKTLDDLNFYEIGPRMSSWMQSLQLNLLCHLVCLKVLYLALYYSWPTSMTFQTASLRTPVSVCLLMTVLYTVS